MFNVQYSMFNTQYSMFIELSSKILEVREIARIDSAKITLLCQKRG